MPTSSSSQSGFRDVVREEASEIGVAAVRRISDTIQQRIVFQKGLNLVTVIPPDRGVIGGRIVVPSNEIHVVTGAGKTTLNLSNGYQIFGQAYQDTLTPEEAAKTQTVYWRNRRTIICALKTTTFTVTLENMEVLDNGYVKYFADVHMMAELDVANPMQAARKIGSMDELLANIEQVAAAELTTAAAKFALVEVIKDRSVLGSTTEEGVKLALKGIGYTLNNLRIGEIRGEAVEKLVQQSTAVVTKNATIEINKAELITLDDNQARERREAELEATTVTAVTAQQLSAAQANEIATADKSEQVAARQHTLLLANIQREQGVAEGENKKALRQVQLDQAENLAEAQSEAATLLEKQRLAKGRELAAAEDDANRTDLVQKRDLQRSADKTRQEAARLMEEQAAAADRQKIVKTTEAEANATALQIQTKAKTDAELLEAGTKAQAAEKTAAADIKLAEATRARERAAGLATQDVRESELANEAKQVEVDRDRGLAQAAVAKEQADARIHEQEGLLQVELDRQTRLAELFAQNPVLVELERLKLTQAHVLALRQVELDAQVQMVTAMAAHMDLNVNLIGDGSKASQIMASVMQIATGAQVVGNQVPAVGNLLGIADGGTNSLLGMLGKLVPYVQKAIKGMNPRVLTSLTVAGLVDALAPVLAGEGDLATTLAQLKGSTSFKMIANLPIASLLKNLGLSEMDDATAAAAA